MSAEEFDIMDDTTVDASNLKKNFVKMYQQHRVRSYHENQNLKFYFALVLFIFNPVMLILK